MTFTTPPEAELWILLCMSTENTSDVHDVHMHATVQRSKTEFMTCQMMLVRGSVGLFMHLRFMAS